MVNPATGGYSLVKHPQYIEEVTYGTTPTASPAFLWVGSQSDVNPTVDMGIQDIRQVGSEDVYQHLLGGRQTRLSLEYNLQSSTFAKYGISAQGGGAGTIDKSLSLLWSAMMDGTENFFIASGCRVNSLKLSGKAKQALTATADIWAQAVTNPETTTGLTTPTYATDPATAPWNFADEGTTPITFAATNLDVTEIDVEFSRNLEEIYTMQQTTPLYMVPKTRQIKGSMTVVWSTATNWTDLQAMTEGSLVWTLKSGTSVLTLNNVALFKLNSFDIKGDGSIIYEKYDFEAKSASVT